MMLLILLVQIHHLPHRVVQVVEERAVGVAHTLILQLYLTHTVISKERKNMFLPLYWDRIWKA